MNAIGTVPALRRRRSGLTITNREARLELLFEACW